MDFGWFVLVAAAVAPSIYAIVQAAIIEWLKHQIRFSADNKATLDALIAELLDVWEHYAYVEDEARQSYFEGGSEQRKIAQKAYGSLRSTNGDLKRFAFLPRGVLTLLMQLEKRIRNADLIVDEMREADDLPALFPSVQKKATYVRETADRALGKILSEDAFAKKHYTCAIRDHHTSVL